MDNAQVTSQMAQINTVTGIDKLNATVQGLSRQFVQLQAVQGASLVGRDVIVPGNKLQIAEAASARAASSSPAPADAVKVEILAASGAGRRHPQPRRRRRRHAQLRLARRQRHGGSGLRFRVSATSGGVRPRRRPLMRDRVDAVSTTATSSTSSSRRSGTVPYSAVKAFN